jgi:hypothetical protein
LAATIYYFMLPADELALFRILARHELTIYPDLVPPGWVPPSVGEEALPALDLPTYYLAAERLGAVIVHPIKRGPDKGLLAIEPVPSPVFHYERSLPNDAGELEGGRLWAELDITDDPTSRQGKHRGLRKAFEDVEAFLRKTFRRSDPKGYWVGPAAARAHKTEGLVLREPGHKGRTYGVWR